MTAAPLTIVELRAENVKRLRSVLVRPAKDGSLVVLSGRNGQGKTSVLDAIAMALGGREQIPSEPIRRGADRGEVVVDLGEIVVKRTFTPSGGGSLIVTNREGARFASPQTMLDALVGKLTFDPLAFSREPARRKAEILRELIGLDCAAWDAERQRIYDERTAVNRRAASLQARAAAMPLHPDTPTEPASAASLAEELAKAVDVNRETERINRQAQAATAEVVARRRAIDDLRQKLEAAERALADCETVAKHLELAERRTVDTAPIQAQMAQIDATNRRVRDNQARAAMEAEAEAEQAKSKSLTERIDEIDTAKANAIAAAAMPIPGLGFDATGGVTLADIPLDQASAAEQLRVSVAIGLAMNPRLRVLLVRDASLLDHDSIRLVAEMAENAGAQLWLERVEEDDLTTVVIEDGEASDVQHATEGREGGEGEA